ncbi:TRAM domain-containing protein [Flavobacteriaceae bacterium]|nr:TRAM domain-containing protein [Flavobacteriaceae bacterium]
MDMQINDEIEVKIEQISNLGKGYGFYDDGRKIFVSKTMSGDIVKAKIIKINSKFYGANLLEILQPSAERVDAPCRYFAECGGCELQHLSGDDYKEFKKNIIVKYFSKIGLPDSKIDWFWLKEKMRRRSTFHINKSGNVGYYKKHSNDLIAIKNCLILEPEIDSLIKDFSAIFSSAKISPFYKVVITNFDNGVAIDLLHLGSRPEIDLDQNLVDFCQKNESIISLRYVGKKTKQIFFRQGPKLTINNFEISVENDIFIQSTKEGQDIINKVIFDFISSKSDANNIIDLYSGVGSYAFNLVGLDSIKKISCFEINRKMTQVVVDNILRNDFKKISANSRNLAIKPIFNQDLKNYDLAIINPPREGAKEQIVQIVKSEIKYVIMISCNIDSFARDISALLRAGYKEIKTVAIDQFYYSHHLEIISILTHEKP